MGVNAKKELVKLKEFLKEKRKISIEDPSTNPISALAHHISKKLLSREIDIQNIELIIDILSKEQVKSRVHSLKKNKSCDIQKTVINITEKNNLKTFEQYKNFWAATKIGTVFTAHPTFNLNDQTWKNIVIATKMENSNHLFKNFQQRRTKKITLQEEHNAALNAINNFWDVRRNLCRIINKFGKNKWPKQYKVFKTNIINCSTWVGYDLDGRTDIGWIDSFSLRLKEKLLMLEKLDVDIVGIKKIDSHDISSNLLFILNQVRYIKKCTEEVLNLISINDQANFPQLEDKLESYKKSVISSKILADKIFKLSTICKSFEVSSELSILASEIQNKGFGVGEIQLRFNALQLHNAFRGILEISTDSVSVRTDLNRLSKLIETVRFQRISFKDIDIEPTTAKRQLMLVSLIVRYIDNSIPLRLLIAECEHPATILSALFFAKKYGIDRSLDISPLFETSISIERGARILEQALDCKPFNQYINNRKRIAIQTGFSDAGRFMGQITSSLAVERLQVKLAEIFQKKLSKKIEVVMFNTHGESIGRGGHPNGIEERNKYVFTAFARNSFIKKGFSFKHETTFQGGDGYLRFGNKDITKNSISSILNTELTPNNVNEDIFYKDTDYSLDFFITLKKWHEDLYVNWDYWQFLDLFSSNLVVSSGSRTNKRTSDYSNERKDPSQIRAISHNAILQQYGYLAHIAGGLGTAANVDAEKFEYFRQNSNRFKQLIEVGFTAKKLSSLNTPLAYARLLDQSYWVARSYTNSEKKMYWAFRKLSNVLKNDKRAESVVRLITMLRDDALDFNLIASDDLNLHPENNERITLDLLQSIRLALMTHVLLLTAQLPTFSARDNLTPENMLLSALKMDVEKVVSQIKLAFPRIKTNSGLNTTLDTKDDYKNIRDDFVDPLYICNGLILEIGVLVSHAFNAHG